MATRSKSREPDVRLSPFARRLLNAWKALAIPLSDATIVIAVSGGADSTALLLATEELITRGRLLVRVVVAHLDHGLRKESKADAKWVESLAGQLGFEFVSRRVDVAKRAKTVRDNLEQVARRARYDFLLAMAEKLSAHSVFTAHTMDDQAETILMRLLRGSGADGIGGIEPARLLDSRRSILLARPLLTWARRSDTETYCRQRNVEYLADAMNKDEQFARVRVRRQLIPLMESFNSKIVEALSRTAELLRDDLEVLGHCGDTLLEQALRSTNKTETKPPSLDVRVLANAPVSVRRRALRQWIANGRGDLRRCELAHIQGIEKLLIGEQGGRIAELPGGDKVVRKGSRLEFIVKPR